MLVSRGSFDLILERLRLSTKLSLDTETTGLRPYHGDRLFSLILAHEEEGKPKAYYFNFWPSYEGLAPDFVLSKEHLHKLKALFDDPSKLWFIHKFNFDMHILWAEGIELAGQVHCTLTQGRVEYNEHMSYELDACLKRIGLEKLDTVEEWIKANGAWDWVQIPGKQKREKNKYFSKVPYDVIIPYGLADATGSYSLGVHQELSIAAQAREFPEKALTISDASQVERRLAKTVFRMERVGVRIDRDYCKRAIAYEADRVEKATAAFKQETGRDYAASPTLFAEVFQADRDLWQFTEKGNPSFESDTLKTFKSPAAKAVQQLRAAKSKLDFYNGFLWHADKDGNIHAQFKPGGARTFRFSSSEPNLQNLTSEEATYCRACKSWTEEYIDTCPECQSTDTEHPEFLVRRAIIPRPGFVFFLPDYDQMEYKMMLDYAKHMMIQFFRSRQQVWDDAYFEVANKVAQGFDVHTATAELMGVKRKYAKTLNFLLLYGGGPQKLADALGIPLEEAIKLRSKYFRALPYVEFMIGTIISAARSRGWIRSWAGHKYNFPNREFAYTGPNTIIQGGCAGVTKISMNKIDALLLPTKSRLVLTIHDELPCEIHESEVHKLPRQIIEQMETVYPHKYIPLTVGAEWSEKSLAEKRKGYPV